MIIKRLLVYHGRPTVYWLADTDADLDEAMWQLFTLMDTDGWFRSCHNNEIHHLIYTAAKCGDPQYVRRMLAEFEGQLQGWELVGAIDVGARHEAT